MWLFDEVVRRCALAVLALACMMLPKADRRRWWNEWSAEVQAILNGRITARFSSRTLEALRYAFGLPTAAYRQRFAAKSEITAFFLIAVPFFVGSLVTRKLLVENILTVVGDVLVVACAIAWLSHARRLNKLRK